MTTASMIEARSAETARLGPQGESMVAKPDAQSIAQYACYCGFQSEGGKLRACPECGRVMYFWRNRMPHVFEQGEAK